LLKDRKTARLPVRPSHSKGSTGLVNGGAVHIRSEAEIVGRLPWQWLGVALLRWEKTGRQEVMMSKLKGLFFIT